MRRNGKASWAGNCWEGYLTIEISNTISLPVKIYSNEGIAQVLFFESDEIPNITYADRVGKYQDQPCYPQIPKVMQSLAKEGNVTKIGVEFVDFDKIEPVDSTRIENCKKCMNTLTYKERSADNLGMCNCCARKYLKSKINEMVQYIKKVG